MRPVVLVQQSVVTRHEGKDMSGSVDVVIVGGGIAGSSLATVMARDGYQVVVLERQTAYRDKVRGEWMACWGVAELLRLNLDKPLLDAGVLCDAGGAL